LNDPFPDGQLNVQFRRAHDDFTFHDILRNDARSLLKGGFTNTKVIFDAVLKLQPGFIESAVSDNFHYRRLTTENSKFLPSYGVFLSF
jgi:hypothetical protein